MNVLVGVDVLEPDRVARALDRWGRAYAARICSRAELAEWGEGPGAVAACLAVKECLIKAVGGRLRPFDWHDLRAGGAPCRAAWEALADAGHALGPAAGAGPLRLAGCAVPRRALCGAALWGHSKDHIVAVVVLVEEGLC